MPVAGVEPAGARRRSRESFEVARMTQFKTGLGRDEEQADSILLALVPRGCGMADTALSPGRMTELPLAGQCPVEFVGERDEDFPRCHSRNGDVNSGL